MNSEYQRGQFLNILEWVVKKHQIYFARVNPDGTSVTCPKCNTHMGASVVLGVPPMNISRRKKELSQRVHKCDVCGYETDRDHAAAEVIRLRGLDNLSTQGLWGSKLPATKLSTAMVGAFKEAQSLPDSRTEKYYVLEAITPTDAKPVCSSVVSD
jgi:hypothetical protein